MKNNFKRIISVFLCVVMIVSSISFTAFAEKDDISITISIEGETLGQGFYVKPTVYTLSEINEIVSAEGYGPYTEKTLTAGIVTFAMFLDYGLEYTSTGSWDSDIYVSSIKDIDKETVDIPSVIGENGGPTNESNDGNADDYLGEFDYSFMSGWMITVDNHMIGVGCGNYNSAQAESEGVKFGDGSVIRWQFSTYGYGLDLGIDNGWGMGAPYYTAANKSALYRKYAELNKEGFFDNSPAEHNAVLFVMENLTATQNEVDDALSNLILASESANVDYDTVLNETMAQMAATVKSPAFGTTGGEWTVMSLARGNFYEKNNDYFKLYYNNIVETVNKTASSVNLNGALHKSKSTENSRLILSLSAIGKDVREVGNWNLIEAYSINGFNWIKKQGINGPIFALIALDSNNYKTTDNTIRQQCIDFILSKELSGGGWALSGTSADPDVTSMVLQSLAPYVEEESVASACERGFNKLSSIQNNNGGFASWGSVNSESIAQVIVACTAHGIDPDKDVRFIKNGKSALDSLLTFYIKEGNGFAHVLVSDDMYAGGEVNAMATDQACYALVAYKRFAAKENSLYNMTDAFDKKENIKATITVPENLGGTIGTKYNAVVSVNTWDNSDEFKLIDSIIDIPEGVIVTDVIPSKCLSVGTLNYNLDLQIGKLRIVYFDAENLTSIKLRDDSYPTELFTVCMQLQKDFEPNSELSLSINGMSLKRTSDPTDNDAMLVIDTENAISKINIVKGISYSAICIYQGDGIDLIPIDKKAVVVFVSELKSNYTLTYIDENNSIEFLYNKELSNKSGVITYIALVPSNIPMENFSKVENYELNDKSQAHNIVFGDVNNDTVINAQDTLNTVNMWLRKEEYITDKQIICANINSDSRINTFDALGIAESFVNGSEFAVILNTVNSVNN